MVKMSSSRIIVALPSEDDHVKAEVSMKDGKAAVAEILSHHLVVHAATVSDTPWSQFKTSDYTDEQYARACLLDRGEGTAKQRYSLPVREPNGVLNRNGCHAATAVLSSTGGTGSARGSKLKATPEQIAAAQKKLVSLYKNSLDEDVPEGLTHLDESFVDELLSHHGVKGMRWGVRKDDAGAGGNTQGVKAVLLGPAALLSPSFNRHTTTRTKVMVGVFGMYSLIDPITSKDLQQASRKVRLDKADKEWSKGLQDGSAWVAVQNKLAEHFNTRIDAVNAKHPADRDFSNEDYHNPKSPEFKKYLGDVHALTRSSIQHAADSLHLENPSGTKKVKVEQDPNDRLTFRMSVHDVKHADDSNPSLTIRVAYKQNAKGLITGFDISKDPTRESMQQSDMFVGAFLTHFGAEDPTLEHYGVKGMQWGVRRQQAHDRRKSTEATTRGKRAPQEVKVYDTIGSSKRQKSKIQTKGGEDHPPTDDAIRVASTRQKMKKSGVDALTNDELRDMTQRMNLEQQVLNLNSKRPKTVGQQFIDDLISDKDNQKLALDFGLSQVAKRTAKRAAKVAV